MAEGGRLGRAEIAAMIPHAGAMCLLDTVLFYDKEAIRACASSHRDPNNPLARDGMLPVLAGLEYGAQAMAVHGRLTGAVGERPRTGYIAGVRELSWSRGRLDDLTADLIIEAEKLAGEGSGVIYRFSIAAGGPPIMTGRATVMLQVEP
jgi:predicted hotdog family 3-hydroxylacyl-ACP dehydratase